MSNKPPRTNSVFHDSPIKKNLTDYKYDTVYFGTPHKQSMTMRLDDVLFLTPLKGIASIFAARPQSTRNYIVNPPRELHVNRDFKEWNKNSTDYLNEVHVLLRGVGNDIEVKDTVEDVTGYVYELKLTPELKKHIWWGNKMGSPDFEVVLKDVKEITFDNEKKLDIKMYITKDPRQPIPVNEQNLSFPKITYQDGVLRSYYYIQEGSDDMSLSEFDHFFQEAEVVKTERSQINLKLLTDPKIKAQILKYTNDPSNPYFDYRSETRAKYGKLPDEVFNSLKMLYRYLEFTKSYFEYKKYFKILVDVVGYQLNDICFIADYGSDNDMLLKYRKIGKTYPLNDSVRLFHTSSKPNITTLGPYFKSRQKYDDIDGLGNKLTVVEVLWPEKRAYFGYNKPCDRMYGSGMHDDDVADLLKSNKTYLYEYVGPKNGVVYEDQELGGVAVYMNTDAPLKVRRITTMEEYKNGFVQESYIPDATTGTSDFDDNNVDPDDCFCESVDTSSGNIDLALLTSPKTKELFKKYNGANYQSDCVFHYNVDDRRTKGPLPDNVANSYFGLIKALKTKQEINYDLYKKYLDVLYKLLDIPSNSVICDVPKIISKNTFDNKPDSVVIARTSKGQLPYSDNVRLFHTSTAPNLTSLNPRFRSRKPGEYIEALFPAPRVYFGYNAPCSRFGGQPMSDDEVKSDLEKGKHIYEYTGPREYITGIFKDPELNNGNTSNAVYVETTHDLPVKEIKTFEEYKKGMRNVTESYEPLSEFDHFFQEAKMKAKTRKELDDSDFALVYKDASGEKIRKYPINDEAHVKAAARMFPRGVPNKYRKEVAGKILRRAHKFGIDTSGWKSLNAANEKD